MKNDLQSLLFVIVSRLNSTNLIVQYSLMDYYPTVFIALNQIGA